MAMQSRAVIEQAKGILIARDRCTADEAFDMLKRTSQARNAKLRDLAQAIVDSILK
jgi:AmiR/NasT family two-component response regulator